jgi:diguanylate cyclase (GGDEF)-like protein
MRLFAGNYRLLGWITLILIGGFLTTSAAAYLASRDAIEHSISEQALPLTGDLIYSGLQKDILYPVFVASLMAQDPTVRDWLAGGEKDQAAIVRYLEETRDRHGMVASFLASDASRKLYHTYGAPEPLVEGRDIDKWYFRLKSLPRARYESSIDIATEYSGQPSLFINHRVDDANGRFIGATGVEIRLDTLNQVLARYQQRYGRTIYFVNGDGKVVLSGALPGGGAQMLSQRPGMRDIAPAILNRSTEPTSLAYRSGKSDVLVNSRYVPEVNWYLVVEQNTGGTISPLTRIFAINFGISFGVTLLVLIVTLLTVNRYQKRLQTIATTDALTGLLNRQALALLFRQSALLSKRSGRPLSAILFDIDHFKSVNDTFGHMAGDAVIRQVAQLALDAVRASDVVTRWGGEEYLVLLGDCNLSQAMAIAENLRLRVAEHHFGLGSEHVPVTISLGVAQVQEDETEGTFFARVDDALYAAKNRGRNVASASHPATLAHQLF